MLRFISCRHEIRFYAKSFYLVTVLYVLSPRTGYVLWTNLPFIATRDGKSICKNVPFIAEHPDKLRGASNAYKR
jgi:hypothetical protein